MESVTKYPGLRFHELKKETSIANGTLQHHISKLITDEDIVIVRPNDGMAPKFYNNVLGKKLKKNKKHWDPLNKEDI